MINLNEKKFEGTSVFNGGSAGTATDVVISVEKKSAEDGEKHPDYKLFATDAGGAKISQGFYVYKNNPSKSEMDNQKRIDQEISRLVHIARAVMGTEYTLPEVETLDAAYATVFKLVNDNAGTKKFNVFTTYGTMSRPSKYLGMRYFNFIEPAGGTSKFKVGNMDNMEKISPDEGNISSTTTNTEDW